MPREALGVCWAPVAPRDAVGWGGRDGASGGSTRVSLALSQGTAQPGAGHQGGLGRMGPTLPPAGACGPFPSSLSTPVPKRFPGTARGSHPCSAHKACPCSLPPPSAPLLPAPSSRRLLPRSPSPVLPPSLPPSPAQPPLLPPPPGHGSGTRPRPGRAGRPARAEARSRGRCGRAAADAAARGVSASGDDSPAAGHGGERGHGQSHAPFRVAVVVALLGRCRSPRPTC